MNPPAPSRMSLPTSPGEGQWPGPAKPQPNSAAAVDKPGTAGNSTTAGPDRTTGGRRRGDARLPPRALYTAQLLIGAVRDNNATAVARLITRLPARDLQALAVTLAALVPYDQSIRELLAWNDDLRTPDGRQLQPHGTHAAYTRHKKRGEQPCDDCMVGERNFQRARARNRRGTV